MVGLYLMANEETGVFVYQFLNLFNPLRQLFLS